MKKVIVKGSAIDRHGKGVFATRLIKKGTRVLRYRGKRLTKRQSEELPDQSYLFELNSRYDIDGKSMARYVNHSCEPNCEADIMKGEIWIITLRDINRGEELSYNYRYNYDESESYPCDCRTSRCIGYMLADEEWYKVRRWRHRKKSVNQ